jgi:hypothetical protein
MFLEEVFGSVNAEKIAQVWYRFSQIQLSSASREEIVFEAKCIARRMSLA